MLLVRNWTPRTFSQLISPFQLPLSHICLRLFLFLFACKYLPHHLIQSLAQPLPSLMWHQRDKSFHCIYWVPSTNSQELFGPLFLHLCVLDGFLVFEGSCGRKVALNYPESRGSGCLFRLSSIKPSWGKVLALQF